MLGKMIKKELKLCIHPTVWIFFVFALCVFIPSYPYEIMYFFSTLGTFYCCLQGRENGDLTFGVTLPVAKRQVATGKIAATVILQCIFLAMVTVAVTVKSAVADSLQHNAAGMEATYATVGFGGMILGLFNVVFFPTYFKNPAKIGVPFLISTVATMLLILLICLFSYVPPFTMLDTPGFANVGYKLVTLAIGMVIYAAFSAVAIMASVQNFQKVDL